MPATCGGLELLTEAESFLDGRELDSALAAFDGAERAGAEYDRCAAGRWMVHMLGGNFDAAWRESDASRIHGRPDPERLWDGENIRNTRVIVRCLHGLGDAVQMFRYIPLLQRQTSGLILEVPPTLMELAAKFQPDVEIITWGEGAPSMEPEWDVQIEITELPYLFRTQTWELPIAQRYISIPSTTCDAIQVRRHNGDSLCVGIVWSSGDWNAERSVPFSCLRSVMNVPGCEFWNLQGGAARDEWAESGSSVRHNATACSESIVNLAALIDQLDIVITPDTLAAHLAGAVGAPVWVMLQHAADWRWMHERDDSPWYPSMQLFRQPRQGDWKSVVAQIGMQLYQFASGRLPLRAA
jgi:hypothetical protein